MPMTELWSFEGSEAPQRIETCVVVWWKGYVKGRFQAQLESDAEPPVVVAESAPVRWRGDAPPERTDALVGALAQLVGALRSAGWSAEGSPDDSWYGLVFSRPAPALDETMSITEVAPPTERGPGESQAVARLQSELLAAREEAERERQLRRDAERRPTLVETRARDVPRATPARSPVWIVVEAAAVVAAAALFLLGFGSLYAAVVATLTTAAVCLGFDSYLATRPRRIAR